MWLAQLMGQLRGEEVRLQDNPLTEWVCDPHTQVKYLILFTRFCSLNLWHSGPFSTEYI